MTNPALHKALLVVRATVRMRVLLRRYQVDAPLPPGDLPPSHPHSHHHHHHSDRSVHRTASSRRAAPADPELAIVGRRPSLPRGCSGSSQADKDGGDESASLSSTQTKEAIEGGGAAEKGIYPRASNGTSSSYHDLTDALLPPQEPHGGRQRLRASASHRTSVSGDGTNEAAWDAALSAISEAQAAQQQHGLHDGHQRPAGGAVARGPGVAGACGRNLLQSDAAALLQLVTASYFSWMLVCVPLGMLSFFLGWGAIPTFVLNLLALIPLALVLGDVTEDLAVRDGPLIGGLLNATFGNVVELILSIAALQKGLYLVVAASLVGSILSNLLLVLGSCFFFGGLYYKSQSFNATSNRATSSLLLLATIGVAIPTAAGHLVATHDRDLMILWISRGTAIVMLGWCDGRTS